MAWTYPQSTARACALCFVLLSVAAGAQGEEIDESNVLVLNAANFDTTLAKYPFLFVEFYAPWCGHCKQLAPHWARAATALKTEAPEVGVAKVDTDKNIKLSERFGVKSFPTIKVRGTCRITMASSLRVSTLVAQINYRI